MIGFDINLFTLVFSFFQYGLKKARNKPFLGILWIGCYILYEVVLLVDGVSNYSYSVLTTEIDQVCCCCQGCQIVGDTIS